jgi:hypothetical protein
MEQRKKFSITVYLALLALSGCGRLEQNGQYDEDGYKILGTLAGKKLSPGQVAYLVREAGFAEDAVGKMVCTAEYESSHYTEARNVNQNNSVDIGLFQINTINWKWCTNKTGEEAENILKDATKNVACALLVAGGKDAPYLTRWFGYKKNKEKCDAYKAPKSQTI